jgi:hypothetical protein
MKLVHELHHVVNVDAESSHTMYEPPYFWLNDSGTEKLQAHHWSIGEAMWLDAKHMQAINVFFRRRTI